MTEKIKCTLFGILGVILFILQLLITPLILLLFLFRGIVALIVAVGALLIYGAGAIYHIAKDDI